MRIPAAKVERAPLGANSASETSALTTCSLFSRYASKSSSILPVASAIRPLKGSRKPNVANDLHEADGPTAGSEARPSA